MRFFKMIALILMLPLSACSYIYGNQGIIKDRDTDYLQAKTIPPLKIPPGLSSNHFEAHYPVSEMAYPADANRKIGLVPPGL